MLIVTARAKEERLDELLTLLDTPPPLLFSGELLFLLLLSQARLQASRFLRFLMYAFSGFASSLMVEVAEASPRLANDFDLPL